MVCPKMVRHGILTSIGFIQIKLIGQSEKWLEPMPANGRTILRSWLPPYFYSLAKQKFPHLVGSKWTAQQQTLGWRHFRVVNRKNQDKWVFAELVAACDPTARFWLNAKALKNRQLWAAGWQTLSEIQQEP